VKTGDLIVHTSEFPGMPGYGVGIIVESWESQIKFEDVPEHNDDDLVVMFASCILIVNRMDCREC